MTPSDIIALGQALYGEPWLKKMADAIEYNQSQLWRVAYNGAPITKRMQKRLDKLERRLKNRADSGKVRPKAF